MCTPKWPPRLLMFKVVGLAEAARDMTLTTGDTIENTSWVWIAVATLTPVDLDRTKALDLPFLCSLSVARGTLRFLMSPRQWVTRLALVIETDSCVHLSPTKSVVTLLTLI